MTDHEDRQGAAPEPPGRSGEPTDVVSGATASDEIPPPIGTVFFAAIYLMVMAALWVAIYVLLVER
ncbi:MAG: hypothetical protein PVJ80_06460 [Gemmatimonadota bacterium]|jgi:hypothetical protein